MLPDSSASWIEGERVRSVYQQALLTLLVTVINAVLTAIALAPVVNHGFLSIWVAMIVIASAVRCAIRQRYFRQAAHHDSGVWARLSILGSLMTGLCWGLGATFMFPAGETYQLFFAFVVGGMCAGAVAVNSAHLPSVLAFVLPASLPLAGRFLAEGSPPHIVSGLMILVFAGALSLISLRAHRAFGERVRLQGTLTRQQRELNEANAQLRHEMAERQKAEARLHRMEKMDALGQLTGGVAHDFNNLLTVILGNLDMIARQPDDPATVKRLASSAFAAGQRGGELIEKLLSFARRQVLQTATVNPNRLISDFLPLLQRAIGETVAVELMLDPQLDPTRVDPSQFQAALLNLAVNARDAMPSGGQLRIETRNVALGQGHLADMPEARPGDYLRITVSDTGIGMDPATTARAFDPFFTTKEVGKGTGLGLSQVYGFVHQAGGHCRLQSAPGRGCTVDLYLPRSDSTSLQSGDPTGLRNVVPLRHAAGGEVVLVVEDEDAVRDMAAESLRALGYGVLSAPDARVALDVLRGPTRVDILFSDVVMPGGMNGGQLALQARLLRPKLKVLLTSGYTITATGGARELPEGVPLLRKPYLREDLAAQLQAALGS